MHQCTWNFILPRIICKHPERSEKIWKSQSLIHDSSMIRFNSFVTSSNHLSTSILANSRFVARIDGSIIAEVESLKIPLPGSHKLRFQVVEILLEWPKCCGDSWNLIQIMGKSPICWNLFHQIMGKSCRKILGVRKVGRLLDEVDKLKILWLVTLVPYFQTPGGHPPPSRANEPSPSRNKIPRSQNRLMWQSGFTVTAGRPFRVGR